MNPKQKRRKRLKRAAGPRVDPNADRALASAQAALDGGARTKDLGGFLTTHAMGDAVIVRICADFQTSLPPESTSTTKKPRGLP